MFLFFETRGFFVGWVRALGACAFGLLSAWSLTVLMLHAVQPWMDALSDVGANGLADAHTGITAAIIVLVFCASQFALLLAGIVIARGFRLPGAPAAAAGAGRRASGRRRMPLDMISRPARLAEQLARHEAPSATTGPGRHAAAAAVTAGRSGVAVAAPGRIGDLYRRPAVTREARRG